MTLRIAIPDFVSPSYFPMIAAVEGGFCKREGLDATVELIFPVTRTYEELRDGKLDFVAGAAHAPLYAFRDWEGCKLLAALSQHMYWFLIVRSDLGAKRGDLNALKGLHIGAAPGPVDGLKRMLVDAGIDPERDVNIGPVPGSAGAGVSFGLAAAKALEEGRIGGFWANGMGAEVAVRGGIGTLVIDARRGDGPPATRGYTFSALVTTQRKLEREPAAVKGVMRALVAAQQALKADPALATDIGKRVFPATEAGLIAELIRRDAPFYDASISTRTVEALNTFARNLDILSGPAPYERVIAAQLCDLWKV